LPEAIRETHRRYPEDVSRSRHSPAFDVVGVIGSQGALAAANDVLGYLPPDFPAAVVYVQHRVPTAGSILAELMRRRAKLPIVSPADGEPVAPGALYVAPAHAQTVIDEHRRFRLHAGHCRGNPLLSSVAATYGPRSIAVILSGRVDDGAAGAAEIKRAGGRVLIQSPRTAEASSMPLAAMATGCYDFVLEPRAIAHALVALVSVAGAAELFSVRAHPLVAAIA
jgi:two-component system, chemotaxis family, protein-glutamate methylesterase/glutaminase